MSTFKCWDPDDSDETDAMTFEAFDPEEAAELFAERIMEGNDAFDSLLVHVRNPITSELYAVDVSVDYDTTFTGWSAKLLEPAKEGA